MSFRTQLALILLVILAASTVVAFVAIGLLRAHILDLLPDMLVFEVDTAFREALLVQGIILVTSAALLLSATFLILGGLVARPLRELSAAMNAYVENGTRTEFSQESFTPEEIRSLQSSFVSFADRVESAHQHDSDISRMKSDFISTAAHQFRTPLTGIRWALEALQKEPLTEDQKALVESAVGKSRDLVNIVGTLLDISSIESGKYRYKFAPVDMRQLSEEITKEFGQAAAARGVSLFFVGDEVTEAPARADRDRVKWVLNNLVENAIRYTPSGGTVQVRITSGSGRIFVKVRDTGIGIPKADRGSIFERFYRAGNAIQKENGGNGLGLYIARSIATDHGGDLSFEENEGGVGTTFTLSLPQMSEASVPTA